MRTFKLADYIANFQNGCQIDFLTITFSFSEKVSSEFPILSNLSVLIIQTPNKIFRFKISVVKL
jgi:hypothetical protein